MQHIADCINILGRFLGKRDVPSLTPDALRSRFGFEQADVMVLFGGSIPAGGDVLADAIRRRAARTYVIVGGEGHTTESLRRRIHEEYPDVETAGQPEAIVFDRYLRCRYALNADLLECLSTNCGNNITNLLALLEANGISFHSIILCQDASMQRRMEAGLRKYISPDKTIISFAAYEAHAAVMDGQLTFEQDIHGMWSMDRYISLLMGEIPRLHDTPDGYGPNGRGFIAHVDLPVEVLSAFNTLRAAYPDSIRAANPLYASH